LGRRDGVCSVTSVAVRDVEFLRETFIIISISHLLNFLQRDSVKNAQLGNDTHTMECPSKHSLGGLGRKSSNE
jgi:hypothetical protein